MRIPVLIESRGDCESAWIKRGYTRRIRISGLERGEVARLELANGHGTTFCVLDRNGCWPLPDCEKLRIVGMFNGLVNVDLVV